jgi:hypothetical protein
MGVLRYDTDDTIVETRAYGKKKKKPKKKVGQAGFNGGLMHSQNKTPDSSTAKKKKSVKRALIEGSCIRKTRHLTQTTSRRTRPIYRHPSSLFFPFFSLCAKKRNKTPDYLEKNASNTQAPL